MRLPIPGGRGLNIAATLVQLGAYLLVAWTYADRLGLLEEVVDGLRWAVRLPLEGLRGAAPGGAP